MLHRVDSSWNIGEQDLTIPADDITHHSETFDNNILSSSINDNNQINENSLGPAILIGLDKHFFEQNEETKDVIFIDNTSLKFNTAEIKIDSNKQYLPSGNYLISFVDATKASSSWDNGILRTIRRGRQDGSDSLHAENNNTLIDEVERLSDQVPVQEEPLFKPDQAVLNVAEARDNPSREQFSASKPVVAERGVNYNKNQGTAYVTKSEITDNESKNNLPPKKKAKLKEVSESDLRISPAKGHDVRTDNFSLTLKSNKISTVPHLVKSKKKRPLKKRRCCYSDSEDSDGDEVVVASLPDYQNLNDMVNDMKTRKLVDEDFAKLIQTGVAEMKTDIFKELLSKNSCSENYRFSNELLAFSFLVFFQNRPAYRFLQRVFNSNWPNIGDLKKWRNLVNSYKPTCRKIKKKIIRD